MKRLICACVALWLLSRLGCAGPELLSEKEVNNVATAAHPQWYADREWRLSLWGTYVFTGEEWDFFEDKYLEADHGWGGGVDVTYFFTRYLGVGLEGWAANAKRHFIDTETEGNAFVQSLVYEGRAIGALLAAFTFRYPLGDSRFAPYMFAGGGAIFGGGAEEVIYPAAYFATTIRGDGQTEAMGQFGGGIEIRLTPHVGWMSDYSWNIVGDGESIFGMFRSGITFAFAANAPAESATYSNKESTQLQTMPPLEWYADREFNLALWGTYIFSNENLYPAGDAYLRTHDAGGGGVDLKYFFMRSFGVGLEGWVVDAKRPDAYLSPEVGLIIKERQRGVGALLGTFTVRLPIYDTRFAPYMFAGGGAIFGGGERNKLIHSRPTSRIVREGSRAESIANFGAGVELRLTRHIGWMNDFSWNVVGGGESIFGMVRSGLNIAF